MLTMAQTDGAPLITLRPYQETCVECVLAAYQQNPTGRAFLVIPTGGGKTIVFIEAARQLKLNTLILAHRQELLQQAADKFRLVDPTAMIGQVGAGRHEWGAPITVASIQTISRPEHLKKLKLFGYGLVIIDECFPAGTRIDGKPIEQIKVGDVVTAFNEQKQTFSQKHVVKTFCRPAGQRLLRIHAGATVVVCTPNHPFYTMSGWKAAEHLSTHEEILYAGDDRTLRAVPTILPPYDEASAGQVPSGEARLLFRHLPTGKPRHDFFRNDGSDQQEICLSAYEGQQSDAQGEEQEQGTGHLTNAGPRANDTWRQWERSDTPTEASCRGVRLADGICGQNAPTQDQPDACSNQLQNRHCQSNAFDCHRSRWHVACRDQSSDTGPQERTGACWVRVDRIEVYEPGRDGTFAGVCPDGLVYNFEVEEDHTYLANGFVVHNCHHSAASGYQAVLDALPDAFVLGVTATPDRMDKQNIEHIFGEPLFSASIIDMVEQDYLSNLRAIAIPTATSLDGLHTQEGDFKLDELEVAVDTPDRNAQVARAYLKHCDGRQALCFAVTVAHAQHLAETFQTMGVQAAMVSGETSPENRKQLLHDYERGTLQVLCNCLDDKTEVLTQRGWVGMETIRPDDITATVNPLTSSLEWQPISRVVRRRRAAGERMVRIKNQTLDVRVTEGHRMMVRASGANAWSFVEAGTLPGRKGPYELPLAAEAEAYPGVPLTDAELEFLGLFATDGSLNKERGSIEIAQAAKSPMCAEIERILTACGFDWKCTERTYTTTKGVGTYRRYRIPKGNIGGQLARRGWGRLELWLDKSLSPCLVECTRAQFTKLLYGLWVGDGLKDAGNTRSKSTTAICGADWVLFDRLQAWAATRGFASNMSIRPNTGGGVLGYIRIRDRKTVRTNNRFVLTSGGNPATFESEWYDEEVWCVTNANGTILTRRNGHVTAMGQCGVLTEGYDAPATSCILMARPTKSRALYMQCIGRGTRKAPGKRDCIILDITDNSLKHRLEPLSLSTALGKHLQDGESILEAKAREEREQQAIKAGESKERTTIVTRRELDVEVNVLARMDWKRHLNGVYVLEVGEQKHRILLFPSDTVPGLYSVWAKLAPDFRGQQWCHEVSLEWAMQHAEIKARLLQSEKKTLVDNNAPWRSFPVSNKQLFMLRKFGIPFTEDMTSGEASDLIGKAIAEREEQKAKSKAEKATKQRRKSGRASA